MSKSRLEILSCKDSTSLLINRSPTLFHHLFELLSAKISLPSFFTKSKVPLAPYSGRGRRGLRSGRNRCCGRSRRGGGRTGGRGRGTRRCSRGRSRGRWLVRNRREIPVRPLYEVVLRHLRSLEVVLEEHLGEVCVHLEALLLAGVAVDVVQVWREKTGIANLSTDMR